MDSRRRGVGHAADRVQRIVIEPHGALDPTSLAMRASPLQDGAALPGPPVLGFLACGAVAPRSAVLACGGFHARYGFGGEEHLLAWSTRLRRPRRRAVLLTMTLPARSDGGRASAFTSAIRALPWMLRERRVVPPWVERWLRQLEEQRDGRLRAGDDGHSSPGHRQ